MKIVVAEQHTTSYLYLLGASFDRELVLNDYLTLLPAKCSPLPDDMIDSVMKYGSQDETDLGILIATLRKTTAQLRVVGSGSRELASRVWNAQTAVVLLSSLLNTEMYWHVQSSEPAESFSSRAVTNVVVSSRMFLPRDTVTIASSEQAWLRQYYQIAWELLDDERFATAVNSLWSYRQSPRHSTQLAVLWAGIESLFGVQSELVFRISTLSALFLKGGKQEQSKIKKLYSARSKAVHEGKQPFIADVSASAELLHALIRKCVERGQLPSEDNLLFE